MQDSTLALFREAVLARKAMMAYTGPAGKEFRPVVSAYWAAMRRYTDASRKPYDEAHRLVVIASKA